LLKKYQMKRKETKTVARIFIVLIGLLGVNVKVWAQPCGPTVPSFTINLTGSPAGVWTSSNVARNGQCCSAVSPDQCVYFDLTLDPNAAGIQIDMVGADPAGSLFYSIGCAGSYPGGTIKCITGVGPHLITFCKPGSNKNVYIITSISKPLFPKDDTVRLGCKQKLVTLGIVNSSVTWQSIYPGTPGQYNSYLDSTNVASPTYSPGAGAPAYIDYKVCGYPIASQCGYSLTVCDTIRIYNFGALSGTITPSPATFCNIGAGSGVTDNAGARGGQAPYSYIWKNI
jgi:large repetitive protein